MAVHEINWNPPRRVLRQFAGFWFPAFFCLVGYWVWEGTGSLHVALAVLIPALLISVVGFVFPGFMRYVFVGWMIAVFPIGWTVSHLVLAIAYYGLLTPIGLLMRVVGYDPMQRRFERDADTYWTPRDGQPDKSQYFRQY